MEISRLPPELHHRIREILQRCHAFDSDRQLHDLFMDDRLVPWRDIIPSARNRDERVDFLIEVLRDKANATSDNALALVLFLHVLAGHTDPADALHHDLSNLAKDLEREFMKDLQ